jgi:hypothetical protein
MSLPVSKRLPDDSVQSFLKAASQRWKDAEALRRSGRRLAALYLMGYSTEMILKAAYFKSIGFASTRPIEEEKRKKAMAEYKDLGMANKVGGHDLTGWAQLLVAKRYALSIPYELDFGRQLVNQAQQVHSHWRETLRYHSVSIYTSELLAVRGAASWFHENRPQILR